MAQIDVARQVWQTLAGWGCQPGPIAGVLGNMQAESGLIADRWEADRVGNLKGGYGLVQWTPASKFRDWAAQQHLNPATVGAQCARLKWEADHGQQFAKPGVTFWVWLKSTISPEQAADDFVRFYERPAIVNSASRQGFARSWFNQLAGHTSPVSPAAPQGGDGDLTPAESKMLTDLHNWLSGGTAAGQRNEGGTIAATLAAVQKLTNQVNALQTQVAAIKAKTGA